MTSGPSAPTKAGVRDLHPAYFALVMATGTVSLAAHALGFRSVSLPLFWGNLAAFAVLWALNAVRIARYRKAVVADLSSHGRAVGFFTSVAATNVVGSQLLLIGHSPGAATALWGLGITLWATLTYTVFTVLVVKTVKPTLPEGIHGGWLLAVVAPQSVSVLGSQLAARAGDHAPLILLFSTLMWLGAGMLYIWIIALIFYRYTFFPMAPSDLSPPYWINMGAMAISTLAGVTLIQSSPHSALVTGLVPFIKGLTLLFWATATWWIPMLVILGFWRHVLRRVPLRYDPLYWGAVFPLAMYTLCTFRLATVFPEPLLGGIPRPFGLVALAAWTLAAAGLARSLWRNLAPRRHVESD